MDGRWTMDDGRGQARVECDETKVEILPPPSTERYALDAEDEMRRALWTNPMTNEAPPLHLH